MRSTQLKEVEVENTHLKLYSIRTSGHERKLE
jgi:hypothetical protein